MPQGFGCGMSLSDVLAQRGQTTLWTAAAMVAARAGKIQEMMQRRAAAVAGDKCLASATSGGMMEYPCL